jgi:hypothetical protein
LFLWFRANFPLWGVKIQTKITFLRKSVFYLGVVRSSLRRAAAGEGTEAHDLQSGEVFGACRSGRRRWGARSAVQRRGDVFLGACRRGRRRGGLQLYQLRAAWGATGQLIGIWLGLWVSAYGGAAQSASMFIEWVRSNKILA